MTKKNWYWKDSKCELISLFVHLLSSNRNGTGGRAKYCEQGRVDSTVSENFSNDC